MAKRLNKSVERLIIYKRLLKKLISDQTFNVYSHQLAEMAGNSAAQVRRDLMQIGYEGSPRKGYEVEALLEKIQQALRHDVKQKIALVGIGNLGRAILAYFSYQQPNLEIVAAFDVDENKTERVISGCRCHHLSRLSEIVKAENITLGIITVPAEQAQQIATDFVQVGVKGILNFAPVPVNVPDEIFIDELDITTKLEKLAFLTNRSV